MCELFAMSSLHPATVRMSFTEFARHSGPGGGHRDGWGIAFYEGRDARVLMEPQAAADSACARLIAERSPPSTLVVSHIRKATQGSTRLENCQPFARELAGRKHVFAHNGHLERSSLENNRSGGCRAGGDTDSEHAFCALLDRMRSLWTDDRTVPPLAHRFDAVADFAAALRPLGPANFLYADGDALFVHAHRRTHEDGVRPPGLHLLSRSCRAAPGRFEARGLAIDSNVERQEVILLASVPLSAGEPWRALGEGEVLAIQSGRIIAAASG